MELALTRLYTKYRCSPANKSFLLLRAQGARHQKAASLPQRLQISKAICYQLQAVTAEKM